MNPAEIRVRRATLEDVPQLMELWSLMRLPASDLARKVTEFQVAEAPDGSIAAAVGLQISGRNGCIHSEGFKDFGLADTVRPMLWDRLQSLANNHGLARFWTQEEAPFWRQVGMKAAEPEVLTKLPSDWKGRPGGWQTVKLREELEAIISADKEFALFMEAEKERTRKAFQQAKILKMVATLLAVILFGIVLSGAFFLVRNSALLNR